MTKFERNAADIEAEFGGVVGVIATPLSAEESETLRYNDDVTFPAASTIKVFVLQTLLERVQAGHLTLNDKILLTAAEKVTGSGVLKTLTADRPYPIKDLATLMIIVSDNTATNLLIEHLGIHTVNAVCQQHGWRDTLLTSKLQHGNEPSMTSPRDLTDYFARLWRGELLETELTDTAKQIYQQQQYTDQLGRFIGYDAYSTETGESSLRDSLEKRLDPGGSQRRGRHQQRQDGLRGECHDQGLERRALSCQQCRVAGYRFGFSGGLRTFQRGRLEAHHVPD